MTQTIRNFIDSQVVTWGQDYVDDLMDRGYIPVQLSDNAGNIIWRWLYVDVNSPLLKQWQNINTLQETG